jgi:hypothetical protein
VHIVHIKGCKMERLISISGITGDMSQMCRKDFGPNKILYCNDGVGNL